MAQIKIPIVRSKIDMLHRLCNQFKEIKEFVLLYDPEDGSMHIEFDLFAAAKNSVQKSPDSV